MRRVIGILALASIVTFVQAIVFARLPSGFLHGEWESVRATSDSGPDHLWWALDQYRRFGVTVYNSTWSDPGLDSNVSWSTMKPALSPSELIPAWASFLRPHEAADPPGSHLAVAVEAGWPLPALGGGFTCTRPSEFVERDLRLFGAIVLTSSQEPDFLPGPKEPSDILPLAPRPLGFLVNTACHAVAIWGCASLLAVLRRRRSAPAGACRVCRHPVLGALVCPECGRSQAT